jgi:hypothetical protein
MQSAIKEKQSDIRRIRSGRVGDAAKVDIISVNQQMVWCISKNIFYSLEIMEGENLIVRLKLIGTFVHSTEKILSGEFSVDFMYDQAMTMAMLLKEHRDIIERRVDHLSYLLLILKILRGHMFNKQI